MPLTNTESSQNPQLRTEPLTISTGHEATRVTRSRVAGHTGLSPEKKKRKNDKSEQQVKAEVSASGSTSIKRKGPAGPGNEGTVMEGQALQNVSEVLDKKLIPTTTINFLCVGN